MNNRIWVLSIYIDGEVTASLHRTEKDAEQTLRDAFGHLELERDLDTLEGDELWELIESVYTPKGYCAIAIEDLTLP